VTKHAALKGGTRLDRPAVADATVAELLGQEACGFVRLLACVVMPDHYHAVVRLMRGSLSGTIMGVNGSVARRLTGQLAATVWQPGFHDRLLRSGKEVAAAVAYVHNNPVRAGLVERQAEWPYPSAAGCCRG